MGPIGLQRNAGIVTASKAGVGTAGSSTRRRGRRTGGHTTSGRALVAGLTGVVALAAMLRIGRKVHTASGADILGERTLAGSSVAALTGDAWFVASSAVRRAGVDVDTTAIAEGLPGRTGTAPGVALLSRGALVATASAMLQIALEVDAAVCSAAPG